MTLSILLSKLHYWEQIQREVQKEIKRQGEAMEILADKAYEGENFRFFLCGQSPILRLTVITYLLVTKYEEYKKMGVSEDIIFETFRDVTLRAELYFKKNGQVGITEEDVIWFRHIMNVEIFKIGSLQFQPFQMLYLENEELYTIYSADAEKLVPSGCPVLNCHVQRGVDLSGQSVENSFVKAKAFFKRVKPETTYRVVLCYSWLLYPQMVQNLSATSNIRRFAEQFQIIGTCKNPEQAMENLFDQGKVNESEGLTFLQKLALEHTELFGFACGIRLL